MKTDVILMKRDDVVVKLIGTCHVGTDEYYNQINDEIYRSCTLYEGIRSKQLEKLAEAYKQMAWLLGLKVQADKIDYKQKYMRRADISYGALYSALNGEKVADADKILEFVDSNKEDAHKAREYLNKPVFRFLINSLIKMTSMIPKNNKDYAIIDLRNNILIHELLKKISRDYTDIAVLYGNAHLKGIKQSLKKLGFKQVDRKTLKAF